MRLWDERVVPRLCDVSLRGREIGEWRSELCAQMYGDIAEVGFGSGLNVRWYPGAVTRIHAIEPNDRGWEMSAKRRERATVPIVREGLDGRRLTLDDRSVDCVLSTFTLCTIPDVDLALREMRRVLRPDGRVLFLEHGLAPDPSTARWQERFNGLQRAVAGGCHLTRDPEALLSAAGFRVDVQRTGHLDGPRFSRPWTWLSLGRATHRQS